LPFENLSPDPDDAYFADGIHEEIISQLGKIASLRVTSRTSVMGYRNNRETSLRAIADELDVTHVLEGSVRRDGAHVRITIQLIAARDDSHLWAENYERELRGIFEVQADVAREVTAALRATLTAEEIARIEARPTGNPEAYEYFLRGRDLYLLGIDYATATELLQRAIVLDPNFALAHAFLSQARSLAYWTGERTEEELALALDAAHTALALDPSLPEAHLALGIYHYRGRRDYERALQAFADARERGLEPGRFHYAVANLLRRQGDFALALEHYREAIKHDPRSVEVFFTLATVYLWTRDYVRAETALDQAISLIPREERAHSRYMAFKARLYVAWGDREMAWAALQNPAGEYPIAWLIDRDLSGARPLFRILYDDPETALGVLRASAASLDSLRYHIVVGEVTERLDESVAARDQYDSARILIESALLGKRSDEAYLYGELGVALAGLGRFEEAKRAGEQSLALLPITKDALDGTDVLYVLAEICVMSRDSNCAVRNLELLLSQPSWVTPHWLRLDPIWDPLRDDPRFQALLDKYDLPAR
jgi:serine/threonine-protein kinase